MRIDAGGAKVYQAAWVVPGGLEFDSVAYMDVERVYKDHTKKYHPLAMRRVIARERGMTRKGFQPLHLDADIHKVVAYMRRELIL